MQKVIVEQQAPGGTWRELHSRFTMEFRALAARPRTAIHREFSVPVAGLAEAGHKIAGVPPLRIALRGVGQVAINRVELTDGVITLQPSGWPSNKWRRLGDPAPLRGLPEVRWDKNRGEVALAFRTGGQAKSR